MEDISKSTIMMFKGVHAYCNFWDKEVAKLRASADDGSRCYREFIRTFAKDTNTQLADGETQHNIKWFGYPVPLSYADAMDRKFFLNMPLYNNAYLELSPFLSRLEKISEGIIPREVIKPTEREIGVFSFERAMMSTDGIPALFSKKHNRYFSVTDGFEIVDKNGVQKKDKDGKFLFKLRLDGSEAVLSTLEEDGEKQFTSSNKKSFLAKTKLPRPNRAVRLFVLVGQNANSPTYWAGVAAVICANFLESVGYSVRITAVLGITRRGMRFVEGGQESFERGNRFNMMDIKAYTETMDSLSLLYVLADPSFFRVRQFEYYMAEQNYWKDECAIGLGSMVSKANFEAALYAEQKKRNIEKEKDTLYYFLGGAEVTSIEEAKADLARIICNAETKNKEILMKMGYEFLEPDSASQEKTYDDFNCGDYL